MGPSGVPSVQTQPGASFQAQTYHPRVNPPRNAPPTAHNWRSESVSHQGHPSHSRSTSQYEYEQVRHVPAPRNNDERSSMKGIHHMRNAMNRAQISGSYGYISPQMPPGSGGGQKRELTEEEKERMTPSQAMDFAFGPHKPTQPDTRPPLPPDCVYDTYSSEDLPNWISAVIPPNFKYVKINWKDPEVPIVNAFPAEFSFHRNNVRSARTRPTTRCWSCSMLTSGLTSPSQ
ncbi:hypothetical protein B0H11DRAFT_2096902 [Mycena galericulata]|nr:hypothetical protein B0H11DRAFT_2096902 [Mycena galericulata]